MDASLEKIYRKLLKVRESEKVNQPPCSFLREKIKDLKGVEVDFKLRPYQIKGVVHLMSMPRFVLGDDTGVGKTPQALSAAAYTIEKNPDLKIFILTTKSAVEQWASETLKFTNGITPFVCKGTPKKRKKSRDEFENFGGPACLIMGHRTLVQDFDEIFEWDWSKFLVIVDEASAIKNPGTQIHQRVAYICQRAKKSWGLTATLIKNGLIEGWGIYQAIVPGLFGSKSTFMSDFCVTRLQPIPGSRRKIPMIVGYSKRHIQKFKNLIDPFFLGRSKQDVAKDLPPITFSHLYVGMTSKQHEKYEEALSGLLEVGEGADAELKETTKLSSIIYCQQIANHPGLIGVTGKSKKTEKLFDILTEGDLSDQNVIVFSRFRKMVDILQEEAKKKKIPCTRITGAEKEKDRKEAQDKFQDHEQPERVIFITTAASEAVNLQTAKAIIFYDAPWSAGDYIQILGRMVRIGSVHDRVFCIHLVIKDTIDTHVLSVLEKKLDLINETIGSRINGDMSGAAQVEVSSNGVSDLFDLLMQDAQKSIKGK